MDKVSFIFHLFGYALLFGTIFAERRACEGKFLLGSKELLDIRSQGNMSVLSEPLGGSIVLLDLAQYIGGTVPPIALSGKWNRMVIVIVIYIPPEADTAMVLETPSNVIGK